MQPAPDTDPSTRPLAARLLEALPALAVVAFAAWLLWPVPRGQMPLSADHTVHLTRIVLTAERLAGYGTLSGWEPTWFFGFPLGELYPQLGDLLIIAIHALGLGALDWPAAYALGFFVVFAVQGLVLVRVGRLFGVGPWPGLVAAALLLGDAGFTREGGWMYTVYFGVWPQALATSLAWLGLGELARALGWPATGTDFARRGAVEAPAPALARRGTLLAGLCFGAALLAHPIALPTLAIGGLILVLTLVPRAPIRWQPALARCLLAGLIGALLAAWWWVPMWQHKAWMASYGWLFAPLDSMIGWLVDDGRWAQRMPAAVGYVALAGVVLASVGAGRVARFVALFALVQWLLASNEAFWLLRLDRLSEGFTHIQYQRFLIGAKPGLYLCAGLAATIGVGWGRRLVVARERLRWPKLAVVGAAALASSSVAACLWLIEDSRATMTAHEVGAVQVERVAGDPSFEADYQAYLQWARARWDARDHDYRIAVRGPRNSHLFMDAPIWTGTPQYKLGFTPGDNFVHKPEAGSPELLAALGVRYIVGLDRQTRARPGEVARFGRIYVRESRARTRSIAWLEGGGALELVDADLRGGLVRVRVHGVDAGARVVFAIAGYPRWHLSLDGEPLEWFEQPVFGDGPPATLDLRAGGQLRGGKAGGDDGSEPTLIAAELPPGTDDAVLELRYEARGGLEWLAELISLITACVLALALVERPRGLGRYAAAVRRVLARVEAWLVASFHPLAVSILVPALVGVVYGHWTLAAAREQLWLRGWIEAGHGQVTRAELGPVKTEMLIRPAVIMRPKPGEPAVVEIEVDELPETLTGWVGIDDDQAQTRGRWSRHHLSIDIRWAGDDQSKWFRILDLSVPHEPERVAFELDCGVLSYLPVHLRVIDEVEGKRIPRLGLALELQRPPPEPDDDTR